MEAILTALSGDRRDTLLPGDKRGMKHPVVGFWPENAYTFPVTGTPLLRGVTHPRAQHCLLENPNLIHRLPLGAATHCS